MGRKPLLVIMKAPILPNHSRPVPACPAAVPATIFRCRLKDQDNAEPGEEGKHRHSPDPFKDRKGWTPQKGMAFCEGFRCLGALRLQGWSRPGQADIPARMSGMVQVPGWLSFYGVDFGLLGYAPVQDPGLKGEGISCSCTQISWAMAIFERLFVSFPSDLPSL